MACPYPGVCQERPTVRADFRSHFFTRSLNCLRKAVIIATVSAISTLNMAEKDVTKLLEALNRGETDAFELLFAEVYPSLRDLAGARLRSQQPGSTLNPTALVHEAYVRMVRYQDMEWKGRTYFFGAASKVMRNIIVDYARAKGADKRKGIHVSLTQAGMKATTVPLDTVIEIDRALEKLAAERPRWVQVVECRYFSGLTIEETAQALDLAESTVSNDWRLARAWLQRELGD